MVDRVPTNPGRVQLVPVSGQENIFDLTMADGATVEGTPLNKLTLLQDATAAAIAALYESSPVTPSTPDAALACLAALFAADLKIEKGTYTGTGTVGVNNKNTLTFSAEPMVVIVAENNTATQVGNTYEEGQPMVMLNGTPYASGTYKPFGAEAGTQALIWSGNSVSWYNLHTTTYLTNGNASAAAQYNRSGSTYTYIAFTKGATA